MARVQQYGGYWMVGKTPEEVMRGIQEDADLRKQFANLK
jgi:hypothetical protein